MDKQHVGFQPVTDNSFIPGSDSPHTPNRKLRVQTGHVLKNVLVKLKAEISLRNSVSLIVGSMIGSGIFVSPGGALEQNGSYGLSLIIWALGGIFSIIGGLCYAELGTTIRKSGANYAYILEVYGGFVAFLDLWMSILIIRPSAQAVVAITFGNYLVQPIFGNCPTPYLAQQLIGAACISTLTFINCASVKWGTRVQDVLTFAKIVGLVIIIITGIVRLAQDQSHFTSAFSGSLWDPGKIILSFYLVLFSYSGWDTLNFVTEEVRNSERNLPLAILISVPLVTILYVLTILSYYIVLEPSIIISSKTVAMAFAEDTLGIMDWVISIAVALSCYSALNASIILSSRLYFVAAHEGYLPQILAMIHVTRFTPIPALLINGLLAIIYLSVEDIYRLIYYFSFSHWFFIGLTITGQLYLRWKEPNRPRPFKIHIIFPAFFCVCIVGLIAVPAYTDTINSLIGVAIGLTGVPVYIVGRIASKLRYPAFLQLISAKFIRCTQLLFFSVLIEKDITEQENETNKKQMTENQ
ncbi:Y+L amino acid transporter 2-like isoform X1 [Mobula birostris]|uniref:Y+L amino acid transporter 2-like isoform X1 n=1 Tax=Mobula birostris TaxID=1983395 RepID=UPI003B28C907